MYSLCRKSIYIHEKSVYNIDVERAEAITEGGVANEVQRVPEAQPGSTRSLLGSLSKGISGKEKRLNYRK